MHLISRSMIKDATDKHPQHSRELLALMFAIEKGYFNHPEALKAVFPSLDNFRYLDKHYVINIGRNDLRLVALIFFQSQKFYVRHVFTHKEYDVFTASHRTKGKNRCV